MAFAGTCVLDRRAVARLLVGAPLVDAVERAFVDLAAGRVGTVPVGHLDARHGAFHVKAAHSLGERPLAVFKVNGNFPGNPRANGLPTIQGFLALSDASDGRLLALMDSIEITAQRTAAASAVAARHLARPAPARVAFVGCGTQARCHLGVFSGEGLLANARIRCFDPDRVAADAFVAACRALGFDATSCDGVSEACRDAGIVVTTTTSRVAIVDRDDLAPGAFVAAVGADAPGKCEISPRAMASARIVADVASQAVAMGDTRGAIAAGAVTAANCVELADVVSGRVAGRSRDDERIVFDSTGTAIEDLAAAILVLERARLAHAATVDFNGLGAGAAVDRT